MFLSDVCSRLIAAAPVKIGFAPTRYRAVVLTVFYYVERCHTSTITKQCIEHNS